MWIGCILSPARVAAASEADVDEEQTEEGSAFEKQIRIFCSQACIQTLMTVIL
jgi:hypothetical protein